MSVFLFKMLDIVNTNSFNVETKSDSDSVDVEIENKSHIPYDIRKRIGKTLAYILRYGALREGLHIFTGGYVLKSAVCNNHMLKRYKKEDIESILLNDTSYRGVLRFETLQKGKHLECNEELVRAAYGQQLESSAHHYDSNVKKLSELSLVSVCANIRVYDLSDFYDEFIINSIIHRLRCKKLLNNKTWACVLSQNLEVLDLEACYLTNQTLTLFIQKCPNLKVLNCRRQGYIFTDLNLKRLLQGLPRLETLNLANCNYLTDKCFHSFLEYLPALKHVNICGIPNITDQGILNFVCQALNLKHIDIFDHKFSNEQYKETLCEVARQKNLVVICRGVDFDVCPKSALTACLDNQYKFW